MAVLSLPVVLNGATRTDYRVVAEAASAESASHLGAVLELEAPLGKRLGLRRKPKQPSVSAMRLIV